MMTTPAAAQIGALRALNAALTRADSAVNEQGWSALDVLGLETRNPGSINDVIDALEKVLKEE
jgi:hypothetical protein